MKYAIKKIKKRNGSTVYIPMHKTGKLLCEWHRIICLYGRFDITTSYLDEDFALTIEDCEKHIEGYRQVLIDRIAETTETVEFEIIDELRLVG